MRPCHCGAPIFSRCGALGRCIHFGASEPSGIALCVLAPLTRALVPPLSAWPSPLQTLRLAMPFNVRFGTLFLVALYAPLMAQAQFLGTVYTQSNNCAAGGIVVRIELHTL